MESEETDIFEKLKEKSLNDSITELIIIEKDSNGKFQKIIFNQKIKMNYLNYLYEKIQTITDSQNLFLLLKTLCISKYIKNYQNGIIQHIQYVLLKMSENDVHKNYINLLINDILTMLLKNKTNKEIIELILYNTNKTKKQPKFAFTFNGSQNIFINLFQNPNLFFESKNNLYQQIITITGKEILNENKLQIQLSREDIFKFIIFYNERVLKEDHNNLNQINENEIINNFNSILNEFNFIGNTLRIIWDLSKKYNKNVFNEFDTCLNDLVKKYPNLTKKYKYNY